VKPTTGSPVLGKTGQSATYLGATYKLQYAYKAETTYVAGEFYWPVERGQKSFNRDFAQGNNLLSQEETAKEITWSSGSKLQAEAVAAAFGLKDQTALLKRTDAKPSGELGWQGKLAIVLTILLIWWLIEWLSRNDNCDPAVQNCATSSGSRSSGGSWGGYSSGGSHK
jgi:hypothetical protein